MTEAQVRAFFEGEPWAQLQVIMRKSIAELEVDLFQPATSYEETQYLRGARHGILTVLEITAEQLMRSQSDGSESSGSESTGDEIGE